MENKNNSFENLYQEICQKEVPILKKSLHPIFTKALILLVILISLIIFIGDYNFAIIGFAFFIFVGAFILIYINGSKEYKSLYRERIIGKLAKSFNNSFTFDKDSGITKEEYRYAEFPVSDIYISKNLISGDLKGTPIKIAHIDSEMRDGDNYIPLFYGVAISCTLKGKFNNTIKVRQNDELSNKFTKNKVDLDSNEFEKYFDVYSTSKIDTMQALTSDIMTLIMDFIKKEKIKIQFTIKENNFFITFNKINFFKVPLLAKINKNKLEKNYNILKLVLEISTKLNEQFNTIN